MIQSRIILTSFLCLLIFNINTGSSASSSDEGHCCQGQHNSSVWNTVQNAVVYSVTGYIIYKIGPPIIDPMFDYIQTNIKHFYLNHWLTEEQRKILHTQQEEKNQKLLEDFGKAQMEQLILFTQSERGKNNLLREKEQEIRHNNTLIRDNERILVTAEREELLKKIETIKTLMSQTSNSELQDQLQKKHDDEIRKWMNS